MSQRLFIQGRVKRWKTFNIVERRKGLDEGLRYSRRFEKKLLSIKILIIDLKKVYDFVFKDYEGCYEQSVRKEKKKSKNLDLG